MRTRFIAIPVLIIVLALANTASSETIPEYISLVELYVDGLANSADARILETTLIQEKEEGVAEVVVDREKGVIGVIPTQDVGWVDPFDFVQRINGTRQYTVLKTHVVAVGRLSKFPVDYYRGGVYYYSGNRYRLQIGDKYFLLTHNDKLDQLIRYRYPMVRVVGAVTAFSDRVPIIQIQEFNSAFGVEEGDLVESMASSRDIAEDYISSVAIQVDGIVCSLCLRDIETALSVEEGIESITGDLETGTVVVVPKIGSRQINLVDLVSRINGARDYTVNKMTVVAVGSVSRLPVKYHEVDVHTHTHSRHKLQVGNTHFILSENQKLDETLRSGYERVRVVGTVSAFSNRVPIMVVGHFQEPGKESESIVYDDPPDTASVLEEKEPALEEIRQPRIDSVRVYVDGFTCSQCSRILEADLMKEEGVANVLTDVGLGLIEVIPGEEGIFDLHDIWQRINAMREYEVIKMDVVASGEVVQVTLDDRAGTVHTHPRTRYKLAVGDFTGFVLSRNERLDDILKSEDRKVIVIGTVSAFRGKVPILHINEYKKIEEQPEQQEA